MAIVYGDISNAETSGTSLTITKPSGLALGNILVAVLTGSSGAQNTWSPPDGFSSIYSAFSQNGGGDLSIQVFYKIATQADVDATNFTFTGTFGGLMKGAMLYASGASGVAPTTVGATVTDNNTVTTAGLTPSANSLLILVGAISDDDVSSVTQASYAIATSNPSWTERYDNFNATSNLALAIATAIRPEATATSTSTIVATPNAATVDVYTQVLIAVAPTTAFSMDASGGSFTLTGADATLTYFSPDLLNTAKPTTSINNTPKP